jgi:hypothetical protein
MLNWLILNSDILKEGAFGATMEIAAMTSALRVKIKF